MLYGRQIEVFYWARQPDIQMETCITIFSRTYAPCNSSAASDLTNFHNYHSIMTCFILQCYDVDERLLARYEYCVDDAVFAKLEIKSGAERMVTEIIATLLLNRHALRRTP